MCHLQRLYASYQSKGLVILGFDASDDKKIAMEMLQANGVTFPNIIDSSAAAHKVCFQQYQRGCGSAVPMSYLIDREGKVLAAWYGYEKGHLQAMAALKKAGGELGEAVRCDGSKWGVQSPEEIRASTKRLFDAVRGSGSKQPAKDTKDH
jgi:hypothetical protein